MLWEALGTAYLEVPGRCRKGKTVREPNLTSATLTPHVSTMDVLEKARDLLKVSAAIKFSLFDGETGKVEPIEWPKVQPNKRLLQPIAEPLNRECERQMRYLSNLASHLQSKVERLKRQSARSRPSVDADGGVKEHTRLEKSVKSQSTPIENEGVPLMGERDNLSPIQSKDTHSGGQTRDSVPSSNFPDTHPQLPEETFVEAMWDAFEMGVGLMWPDCALTRRPRASLRVHAIETATVIQAELSLPTTATRALDRMEKDSDELVREMEQEIGEEEGREEPRFLSPICGQSGTLESIKASSNSSLLSLAESLVISVLGCTYWMIASENRARPEAKNGEQPSSGDEELLAQGPCHMCGSESHAISIEFVEGTQCAWWERARHVSGGLLDALSRIFIELRARSLHSINSSGPPRSTRGHFDDDIATNGVLSLRFAHACLLFSVLLAKFGRLAHSRTWLHHASLLASQTSSSSSTRSPSRERISQRIQLLLVEEDACDSLWRWTQCLGLIEGDSKAYLNSRSDWVTADEYFSMYTIPKAFRNSLRLAEKDKRPETAASRLLDSSCKATSEEWRKDELERRRERNPNEIQWEWVYEMPVVVGVLPKTKSPFRANPMSRTHLKASSMSIRSGDEDSDYSVETNGTIPARDAVSFSSESEDAPGKRSKLFTPAVLSSSSSPSQKSSSPSLSPTSSPRINSMTLRRVDYILKLCALALHLNRGNVGLCFLPECAMRIGARGTGSRPTSHPWHGSAVGLPADVRHEALRNRESWIYLLNDCRRWMDANLTHDSISRVSLVWFSVRLHLVTAQLCAFMHSEWHPYVEASLGLLQLLPQGEWMLMKEELKRFCQQKQEMPQSEECLTPGPFEVILTAMVGDVYTVDLKSNSSSLRRRRRMEQQVEAFSVASVCSSEASGAELELQEMESHVEEDVPQAPMEDGGAECSEVAGESPKGPIEMIGVAPAQETNSYAEVSPGYDGSYLETLRRVGGFGFAERSSMEMDGLGSLDDSTSELQWSYDSSFAPEDALLGDGFSMGYQQISAYAPQTGHTGVDPVEIGDEDEDLMPLIIPRRTSPKKLREVLLATPKRATAPKIVRRQTRRTKTKLDPARSTRRRLSTLSVIDSAPIPEHTQDWDEGCLTVEHGSPESQPWGHWDANSED